jgi:hypothetical protein
MAITQVNIKTALGLYFLGAAVKIRNISFTSRNAYRLLKKSFNLFQQNLTPLACSTSLTSEQKVQIEHILKL